MKTTITRVPVSISTEWIHILNLDTSLAIYRNDATGQTVRAGIGIGTATLMVRAGDCISIRLIDSSRLMARYRVTATDVNAGKTNILLGYDCP